MDRTQVYLPSEQRQRLKAAAKQQDKAMADLIREAIDRYLEQSASSKEDPLLRLIGAGSGLDPERKVSANHHLFLRKASHKKAPRR